MRKRVLIPRPLNHLPGAEDLLAAEVDIVRSPGLTTSDVLEVVGDVHAVVASGVEITQAIIASAPLLQVIATATVGYDRIDVAAATQAAIPVIANTGVAPEAVAEFALGLMIVLARRIVQSDRDLRRTRNWPATQAQYFNPQVLMGTDLSTCTIGIVGMGHIGSAVARVCRAAFGPRMLGYDPYVGTDRMAALGVEKVDDLLTLASKVDFLSLHVALDKGTRHLVDEAVLRAMRPTAYLINCARGPVVDEAALIRGLTDGWIAGAALDVFEREPLPSDNPLWDLDNVILTPHIAGVSFESTRQRAHQLAVRLLSALRGERPAGLVNPEVWDQRANRLSAQGGAEQ